MGREEKRKKKRVRRRGPEVTSITSVLICLWDNKP